MRSADSLKVQFGCGRHAPEGWINFDISPTMRLQQLPLVGALARKKIPPLFPRNVRYGDITRGLPLADQSVSLLYCSHTLEHLALADFRVALKESLRVLKPGGTFRGVMPDLAYECRTYLASTEATASIGFLERTLLGEPTRPRGLEAYARLLWGNSRHLWMWDYKGLETELYAAGFIAARRAEYGDGGPEFIEVEKADSYENCLGFECRKPGPGTTP